MSKSPAEKFAESKLRTKYSNFRTFSESYAFPLDDFQNIGCRHLEDGKSVLIAAPTGAGKTIVGEFATFLAMQQGVRCYYTTPIKALSNQKYQEFVAKYYTLS